MGEESFDMIARVKKYLEEYSIPEGIAVDLSMAGRFAKEHPRIVEKFEMQEELSEEEVNRVLKFLREHERKKTPKQLSIDEFRKKRRERRPL